MGVRALPGMGFGDLGVCATCNQRLLPSEQVSLLHLPRGRVLALCMECLLRRVRIAQRVRSYVRYPTRSEPS